MKAITYAKYGSPDVLALKDVPKPVPTGDQVLVKICASSLNAADLDYLTGTFFARLGGLQRPAHRILGSDVAGRVEAIGEKVTRFRVGDAVFGDTFTHGFGAFAEYVCAPERVLALKPAGITFEQAATLPQSGVLALQALRDKVQLAPGKKVLINGAGGGVGTFAVQIAKTFGAEITGVDKASKFDLLRTLGANHLIDYTQTDFTQTGQQYDLIVDVIAQRSMSDYQRALNPNGVYAMIGGSNAAILQIFTVGAWLSRKGSQKLGVVAWDPSPSNLTFLAEWIESGTITPVIDKSYPLNKLTEALNDLITGAVKGKIVITVSP